MSQLELLKALLGISGTSQDAMLSAIISIAEADFLAMTHRATVPTSASNITLRMALTRYNCLKDEGLTSVSYNGISESFSGYSEDLTNAINGFRKMVVV